jgi:alanyl-tRNA synthetase
MAGATGAPVAQAQATQNIAAQKDPKVKMALTKASKGQNLNPEEQKMVSGVALMKAESRLRKAFQRLNESEVQQAQVVLAAQDMVDSMQGMLEDVSAMQFKELPALVDSIKNQVGQEQAMQFNTDAGAAFSGLMQNLQSAKQQLDAALGVVTGQAPAAIPGMEAGAEIGADLGAELGADLGAADDLAGLDADADFDEVPAEPKAGLGRARR